MSHKKLRPFILKVSVLGYFPLRVYMNIHLFYLIVHILLYICYSVCQSSLITSAIAITMVGDTYTRQCYVHTLV